MTKARTFIFSFIPVAVLLLILEIIGRWIYPFDLDGRARVLAERDPRREAPFENASGQVILQDIFGMERRYLTFLGFLGAPNAEKATFSINELGFRDGAVEARTGDEYRVLLLGGSAAWGWGASSNESTVSGALQTLLNEDASGVSYRVMNGAYLAWTSLQERIALLEFFDRFDPDLVISLSGFNDIVSVQYGNSRELLRIEFGMLEKAVENNLTPMSTLKAIRKVVGSLGIWRLVVYLKEQMPREPPGRVDYKPSRAEYGIPKIIDRYQSMADYAARRGAKYLLALQPDIYTTDKQLRPEEELVGRWLESRNSENFDETWKRYRADLVQNSAKLRGSGVTVVDLESVFDAVGEPVFVDDSHFNDRGYLAIAKALREVIGVTGGISVSLDI